MTARDDGGAAFPMAPTDSLLGCFGMSMRCYFAAAALQGLLANPARDYDPADAASLALQHADAMLRERAK